MDNFPNRVGDFSMLAFLGSKKVGKAVFVGFKSKETKTEVQSQNVSPKTKPNL